jgi:hypothetical protein
MATTLRGSTEVEGATLKARIPGVSLAGNTNDVEATLHLTWQQGLQFTMRQSVENHVNRVSSSMHARMIPFQYEFAPVGKYGTGVQGITYIYLQTEDGIDIITEDGQKIRVER